MTMLRNAVREDATLLFQWANEAETRRMSVNSGEINWEDHVKWFEKKLEDNHTRIFILEDDRQPIGQIRLENRQSDWLIGYSIDPAFRGKGFGKKIVELAMDATGRGVFVAFVKPANTASVKIFSTLGFINLGIEEKNHEPLIKFKLEK